MTFGEGGFAEAVEQLEDEEERIVAWAGHHYFRGEAEQAMELAARAFASDSAEIRLSARWLHAMAAIGLGDVENCRADFAEVVREGEERGGRRGARPERVHPPGRQDLFS